MVDKAFPVALRDGNAVPVDRPFVDRPASPRQSITVLFERETEQDGKKVLTTAVLNSATSIHQIKLSGPHQGWFKSGDRLVRLSLPAYPRLATIAARARAFQGTAQRALKFPEPLIAQMNQVSPSVLYLYGNDTLALVVCRGERGASVRSSAFEKVTW